MWLSQGLNEHSTSKTLDTAIISPDDPMSKVMMAHNLCFLKAMASKSDLADSTLRI